MAVYLFREAKLFRVFRFSEDRIAVRIFDIAGRVLEMKDRLSGSQTITMGHNLKAGYYIVEVTQGNESKLIKVVKQ